MEGWSFWFVIGLRIEISTRFPRQQNALGLLPDRDKAGAGVGSVRGSVPEQFRSGSGFRSKFPKGPRARSVLA